ncbi:MAG: DUF6323 family protein [Eubacteriales bacterium]|nr:DUF6323 family protein [Eubacteriales bacterium]MDD3881021.1 DUF6323 family protein [Eubacteriales bacterium]MDD4511910.1 DUF6323 family protein [Eubacteriales bacterium]
MEISLANIGASETRRELTAVNEKAARYGLALTEGELEGLLIERKRALEAAGRVEMSSGILPRLIEEFMPSPYVSRADFAETLASLLESFYYFKNECEESMTDGELLERMRYVFDEKAHGALELLSDMTLCDLMRGEVCDEEDEDDEWD